MAEYPDERIPYVHGSTSCPSAANPVGSLTPSTSSSSLAKTTSESASTPSMISSSPSAKNAADCSTNWVRCTSNSARGWTGTRGRRRRVISHEEPLPPTSEHPTPLSGVELRAICLAFLRRARGPLTLRQVHALIHRAGYLIASWYPVKALADALGHEADTGRLQRIRRGTYANPPDATDVDPDDEDDVSTLPDW